MINYFANSSEIILSINRSLKEINLICEELKKCFNEGGKLLAAGNGGSASDAQHFVGELTCTYKSPNRKALPAISLANNPSAFTAWANDFDHLDYFARQVEGLGKKNDILFLISTGGGDLNKNLSVNLIRAAQKALSMNLKVISLVGKSGGELEKISNLSYRVASNTTSHIQEAHISIIHYLCESLENI